MSLQTIVSRGIQGRRRPHGPTLAAAPRPGRTPLAVLLKGSSMRVLETALAATALGTALLLGVGR